VNAPLLERAPAKVNLTLSVLGRRDDGLHELESLVVFAQVADQLTFSPGGPLKLEVSGPFADACGTSSDNLVLRAADTLADEFDGLALGRFGLMKMLPVAAGLGGGSADAAAALRLLARAYDLAFDDGRILSAARRTGADVSVCLDPRTRLMYGAGELLSTPLRLPSLAAVLVNPGMPLPTGDVFAAFDRQAENSPRAGSGGNHSRVPREQTELIAFLRGCGNDLEAAAISLQPAIAELLAELRATAGCLLARMSGSGATCFGIYQSYAAAEAAGRALGNRSSRWVRATMLGAS
jgi:4-diphosphocytidyl-2-C-methyl-D-erythritol kinase